jgi:hypothetical protein
VLVTTAPVSEIIVTAPLPAEVAWSATKLKKYRFRQLSGIPAKDTARTELPPPRRIKPEIPTRVPSIPDADRTAEMEPRAIYFNL